MEIHRLKVSLLLCYWVTGLQCWLLGSLYLKTPRLETMNRLSVRTRTEIMNTLCTHRVNEVIFIFLR